MTHLCGNGSGCCRMELNDILIWYHYELVSRRCRPHRGPTTLCESAAPFWCQVDLTYSPAEAMAGRKLQPQRPASLGGRRHTLWETVL